MRSASSQSFVDQSAQLLDDGEVMTRFREVGNPEIDRMIAVYNRMVDNLREERVRLQEQQYFLGRLLTASPSGVITLNLDGRVAEINPAAARLLRRSSGDLADCDIGSIGAPLAPVLERLAAGRVRDRGARRAAGASAASAARSSIAGFQRTFYLLEELTEELRRSEKAAYEKLIRMMSHEVNNSVGAAQVAARVVTVVRGALPAEPRADLESALRVAIDRMERLNAFMRSFADVVRIPEPRIQACGVEGLLDGVVRLMQAQTAVAGIRWVIDRQGPVGVADVDPVQFEQALVNILKNAIEAAGEAGTVVIRTGRKSGRGYIEIEDSGGGISEEVRPKLFTPFFSTKPNGQGIGLTMVQEILTKHRFEYSLDGAEGGPTTFRIAFPVRDEAKG